MPLGWTTANNGNGQFDSNLIGQKVYGRPIECLHRLPTEPLQDRDGILKAAIGFDLGGDRKTTAVIDGKLFQRGDRVGPYHENDPQYHLSGILTP